MALISLAASDDVRATAAFDGAAPEADNDVEAFVLTEVTADLSLRARLAPQAGPRRSLRAAVG